jgi:hypothetical protein
VFHYHSFILVAEMGQPLICDYSKHNYSQLWTKIMCKWRGIFVWKKNAVNVLIFVDCGLLGKSLKMVLLWNSGNHVSDYTAWQCRSHSQYLHSCENLRTYQTLIFDYLKRRRYYSSINKTHSQYTVMFWNKPTGHIYDIKHRNQMMRIKRNSQDIIISFMQELEYNILQQKILSLNLV